MQEMNKLQITCIWVIIRSTFFSFSKIFWQTFDKIKRQHKILHCFFLVFKLFQDYRVVIHCFLIIFKLSFHYRVIVHSLQCKIYTLFYKLLLNCQVFILFFMLIKLYLCLRLSICFFIYSWLINHFVGRYWYF